MEMADRQGEIRLASAGGYLLLRSPSLMASLRQSPALAPLILAEAGGLLVLAPGTDLARLERDLAGWDFWSSTRPRRRRGAEALLAKAPMNQVQPGLVLQGPDIQLVSLLLCRWARPTWLRHPGRSTKRSASLAQGYSPHSAQVIQPRDWQHGRTGQF